MRSNIKEKLEHYEFLNVNQLLQKAVAAESRLKESQDVHRSHRPNMHVIESYSNSSNDEVKSAMLMNLFGLCWYQLTHHLF
jgi:fumarate hydratase class II